MEKVCLLMKLAADNQKFRSLYPLLESGQRVCAERGTRLYSEHAVGQKVDFTGTVWANTSPARQMRTDVNSAWTFAIRAQMGHEFEQQGQMKLA